MYIPSGLLFVLEQLLSACIIISSVQFNWRPVDVGAVVLLPTDAGGLYEKFRLNSCRRSSVATLSGRIVSLALKCAVILWLLDLLYVCENNNFRSWLWKTLDSLQRRYCRIAALTDLLIFLKCSAIIWLLSSCSCYFLRLSICTVRLGSLSRLQCCLYVVDLSIALYCRLMNTFAKSSVVMQLLKTARQSILLGNSLCHIEWSERYYGR